MPGIDGIEATKQLTAEMPSMGIIALSMLSECYHINDMLEAGAKGYLVKNAGPNEIEDAINAVYNGGTYYCKETTAELIKVLAKKDHDYIKKNTCVEFSEAEIDIIKLICEQYSNREIAKRVHLAKRTIDWHRNKILQKIDAKNTAGIITYAIKHGIC